MVHLIPSFLSAHFLATLEIVDLWHEASASLRHSSDGGAKENDGKNQSYDHNITPKKERDEEIQRFGTNMFVFEFPPEFHLHCLNQDDEGRTLHEQAKDGEDMSDISDSAASSFGSVDEDCLMAFEDALETQRLMQEYASRRSLLPSMEAVDSLHSDSLKDTDEMI
mmetsp:Transcript_20133/g.32484  ORF Transcript_20133/g.32484 Transcript_20133/m.32484 type:complete len:166 (+) Transcript_20133:181-678(+)